MRVPWLPVGYLRTCRSCSEPWVTSRAIAKLRSGRWRNSILPGEMRGALRGVSRAGLDQVFAMQHQRAAANDDDLALVADVRRCPKCKARDYREKRLWRRRDLSVLGSTVQRSHAHYEPTKESRG